MSSQLSWKVLGSSLDSSGSLVPGSSRLFETKSNDFPTRFKHPRQTKALMDMKRLEFCFFCNIPTKTSIVSFTSRPDSIHLKFLSYYVKKRKICNSYLLFPVKTEFRYFLTAICFRKRLQLSVKMASEWRFTGSSIASSLDKRDALTVAHFRKQEISHKNQAF